MRRHRREGKERWVCSPNHHIFPLLCRRRWKNPEPSRTHRSPFRTQHPIGRLSLPLDSRSGSMQLPCAAALSSSRGQIRRDAVSHPQRFSVSLDGGEWEGYDEMAAGWLPEIWIKRGGTRIS
ncbi:unnamed protein product [Linum trigynum]|uniref:Uncharacterized protein n=1 Tax=Linum trigynum TaxID=586398 RepID=A0AAV2GBU8_9ROSI